MLTSIITIGNSRGIRIPKLLLEESKLEGEVKLLVKKGEIRIVSAPKKSTKAKNSLLLSEKSLNKEWNNKEEDLAWESLQ